MQNSQDKIFAVGDIHGCYHQLETLMERIPYQAGRDTLVFLGDYINRGPDSFRVIELVSELKQNGKVITLLGNHEVLLMEYQSSSDTKLIPYLRDLGIETTLESYQQSNLSQLPHLAFMPEQHRQLFHTLVPYWETESYIFVHAGLSPKFPLEEQSLTQLTEMRDFYQADEGLLQKTVIFGHTPFQTPFVKQRKIGIDTGAVYGNMLTAVELPGRIFHHA